MCVRVRVRRNRWIDGKLGIEDDHDVDDENEYKDKTGVIAVGVLYIAHEALGWCNTLFTTIDIRVQYKNSIF